MRDVDDERDPVEVSDGERDNVEVSDQKRDSIEVSDHKRDSVEVSDDDRNPVEAAGDEEDHIEAAGDEEDHIEAADDERDPVEAADDERDLYEISSWEQRSLLDRISVAVYWLAVRTGQVLLVLVAVLIFVAVGGLSVVREPSIGVLTALSALPALALAGYVWYSDVTANEPLSLLAATFILGVLTAGFAAVVNSLFQPVFTALGGLGMVAFFYLIVGPVEESVKLLAVRLYAYNDARFSAVIDGAVYGAVAGLGFATIENAIYISGVVGEVGGLSLGLDLIGIGGDITATRALAGPGHVVYSSFAGYYLGLAKFNPENRGPIIVKGLIIAALIHATYNATVGIGSGLIQAATGLPRLPAFFVFVVLYVGGFGLLLYRKIQRYTDAHRAAHSDETTERDQPAFDTEAK